MMVLGISPVFAANDLTMSASTQISVGGYILLIYGADRVIDSLTVSDGSFSVTLSPSASFSVSSSDRKNFSVGGANGIISDVQCTDSLSSVTVSALSTSVGSESITITPLSTTCVAYSGGGGGGGSVYVAPTTQSAVNLGLASNFVILSKSGISNTGTSAITGNIGVSPIAATAITGFGLTMDSTNTFSKSSLVSGNVYASTYTSPTPATMTTAVSNMETAYTDAAGRTNPTATELGAGNIGGMTLAPGLYKWGTNVTIPTDVTLSGGANDVWIFQIGGNLNISSGKKVILSGGAQASNIFWQVAGQTTLGTTSVFNGTILDQTAIVMNTGATLNGRALAQTAVTLDSNIVSSPVAVSAPTPVVVVTTPTSNNSNSSTSETTSPATIASTVTSTTSTSQTSAVPVTTITLTAPSYSFKAALTLGSKGTDVTELQKVLVAGGYLTMPSGVAYGTFGNLTLNAVKKYQEAKGIAIAGQLGYGNVGPATRAKLNATVVTSTTAPAQTSSASVEALQSQLRALQAQLLILLSQQLQLLKGGQ